jgi:hypothetical protein
MIKTILKLKTVNRVVKLFIRFWPQLWVCVSAIQTVKFHPLSLLEHSREWNAKNVWSLWNVKKNDFSNFPNGCPNFIQIKMRRIRNNVKDMSRKIPGSYSQNVIKFFFRSALDWTDLRPKLSLVRAIWSQDSRTKIWS